MEAGSSNKMNPNPLERPISSFLMVCSLMDPYLAKYSQNSSSWVSQAKDPTKSLRSSFWLMDAMMESAYALSPSDLAPPAAAPPPTPPPLAPETPLVDPIFAKKKNYTFPPKKQRNSFLVMVLQRKKVFFRFH